MPSVRSTPSRRVWLPLAAATALSIASFSLTVQTQAGGAPAPAPRPQGTQGAMSGAVPAPAPQGGRGAQQGSGAEEGGADFSPKPPIEPLTPGEEAARFILPAGYHMELVASDPDIVNPRVYQLPASGTR
jgi:hypothetical protein